MLLILMLGIGNFFAALAAHGKISRVFYDMSGSDAYDTLGWYYNDLRGKPYKKKII